LGFRRYRDPQTGKTWTGRGKPPNWIAAAKDRQAFLISPGAGEDGASSKKTASGGRKSRTAAGAAKRSRRSGIANKPRVARKTASTPAVQIESGAASE
jgi:hypothetical protein